LHIFSEQEFLFNETEIELPILDEIMYRFLLPCFLAGPVCVAYLFIYI